MSAQLAEHPLFTTTPVGKQGEFHSSLADSRWCIAGNQSGKTTAGAREAVWFALGLHPFRENIPVPNIGWIVTLDRTFVDEVLMPAVLAWLPKQFIKKITRADTVQLHLTNGSRIVFRTYGQGWMKFQGAKIHWAWFDEECPRAVYDETMVRLMAFKGPHWVTMTPLQGKTWVHSEIVEKQDEYGPDELALFSWKTTENTSLDASRVEKVFGRMPVEIRDARMSGAFVDLEGLVWKQFDERVHVVNPFRLNENWPVVVGMDYGYRHPFAAVFLAVDETGRVIVWRTYRRAERLLSQHAKAILEIFLEHAPHLVDQRAAKRVIDAVEGGRVPNERPLIRAKFVIDASAQQCKRELLPFGISADNSDRNVFARIERVGELLLDTAEGRPGLVIMRGRNGDLVDEMRHYSWKKSRGAAGDDKAKPPEPQDIHDDACDGLGYGVMDLPARAKSTMLRPPEGSPEWLRRIRQNAARVKGRLGNEVVPAGLVHSRLLRMGRAW